MSEATIIDYTDEQYKVILEGIKDKNPQTQMFAIVTFQYVNYERLVAALDNEDKTIQKAAIWVSGQREEVRIFDRLLKLLETADAEVCYAIVMAWASFKDERLVESSIRLLGSLDDKKGWTEQDKQSVSQIVINALDLSGSDQALTTLRSLLKYGNEYQQSWVKNIFDWREDAPRRAEESRLREEKEREAYQKQVDEKQREILKIDEATVYENTGKGWDRWHAILRKWGFDHKDRNGAAKYLRDKYGQTFWWARTITIHYEQTLKLPAEGD